MKKTRKSLLSVLLTLVMLVSLVPALATEARAANPWPEGLKLSYHTGFDTRSYTQDFESDGSFRVVYDGDRTVTVTLNDFYLYSTDFGITLEGGTNGYNLLILLSGESWITTKKGPAIANKTGGDVTFGLVSGETWADLGLETRDDAIFLNANNNKVVFNDNLVGGVSSASIEEAIEVVNGQENDETKRYSGSDNDWASFSGSPYAYITLKETGEEEASEHTVAVNDKAGLPTDLQNFKFSDYDNYTITERSGLNKLSFNVGLKNSVSYEGSRPSSTYRYLIAHMSSATPAPEVTFANGNTDYSLTFGENSGGTEELKTVMLNISKPDGVAPGLHVYRITQRYNVDQHNAGFDAKDNVQNGSFWDTDYYLFLNVNGGGKITQAILLPGDLDSNVTNDKRDGFYIEYASSVRTHTVTLAKRSQTGIADGTYTFDVEFELPQGINTANIEIEGWNGTPLNFSPERKATANGVTVRMNDEVDMRGIPEGTIVRVKETNSEQYKVTSTVENMTPSQNLTTGEEGNAYTTYGTVSGNGGRITYFNDVKDISLTGVSLRYAPYMAMMGAGLAVVGLSKTRRKEEEK